MAYHDNYDTTANQAILVEVAQLLRNKMAGLIDELEYLKTSTHSIHSFFNCYVHVFRM